MTEPLDKKIKEWKSPWDDKCSAIGTNDVKSSLSNLKKRLKEETKINGNEVNYIIDKVLLEIFGEGLLDGENE